MFASCLQIFLLSWQVPGAPRGDLGADQVSLNQTGWGCQGLLGKGEVIDLREERLT